MISKKYKEIINLINEIDKIDDINKPLTNEEYKENMKFEDNDINISNVKFKKSTAKRVVKEFFNK